MHNIGLTTEIRAVYKNGGPNADMSFRMGAAPVGTLVVIFLDERPDAFADPAAVFAHLQIAEGVLKGSWSYGRFGSSVKAISALEQLARVVDD